MYSILDQSTATEMYGRERYATGEANGIKKGIKEGKLLGREEGILKGREEGMLKGREEGILKGREEGRYNIVVEMYKNKSINLSIAAKTLNMSKKKFLELANS